MLDLICLITANPIIYALRYYLIVYKTYQPTRQHGLPRSKSSLRLYGYTATVLFEVPSALIDMSGKRATS